MATFVAGSFYIYVPGTGGQFIPSLVPLAGPRTLDDGDPFPDVDFTNLETVMEGSSLLSFRGVTTITGPSGPETVPVLESGGSLIVYSPYSVAATNFPGALNPGSNYFPGTTFTVCFAAGTRIATPEGETAVEALRIGDLVTTDSGKAVPVKWVGVQTVSTRFGPADRLMPVRVRAGALGDGLPLNDLILTADHALLIDGLLVNAGALANGASIAFVPFDSLGDSYTVYHIETEAHDVILAEGAPAETYIDYAARRAFDNYAEYVALYGEDRTIPEMTTPRISSARMLPLAFKARFGLLKTA